MKIKVLFFLVTSVFALSTNSATLVTNGGQLLGAADVDVGGTLYDVSFLDGSCDSLYGGCSSFTFNTQADAALASQALLDQVFIGAFDSNPSLTNGINSPLEGEVRTPWVTNLGVVTLMLARNGDDSDFLDFVFDDAVAVSEDTGNSAIAVYAVWAPSPVPLPAAAWLFGSALLGLAAVKRKKT